MHRRTDMTNYASIDALNWSSLKLMADSPLMYQWRQEHPRPDTKSLSLGRKEHMAVLEPERYEQDCVRRPAEWDSWRTKASKEWRDEQTAAGKEVMNDAEADKIELIRNAIYGHADAMRRLAGTRREESIVWTVDGVRCKGRVDAIASDRVVDLKTTRNLGLFVRRDAGAYLYHGQLAWYLDGAISAGACSPDAQAYAIAVETEPPYDCACFALDGWYVEEGRALWKDLLEQWISCRDAGVWPGRYPNETPLQFKMWSRYEPSASMEDIDV